MRIGPELLLVGAVAAVGTLHTMVPDHWAPIALLARQRGWSRRETAAAASRAGAGHALSTLALGAAFWLAGLAVARRFGALVDIAASLALVGFGGWIAVSAWGELRRSAALSEQDGHRHDRGQDDSDHDRRHHHHHGRPRHDHRLKLAFAPASADRLYLPLPGAPGLTRHAHIHRHGRGWVHAHWHDHAAATVHPVSAAEVPLHDHRHKTSGRTALLLILGSSPMVEGIPAFFAAAKFGAALIGVMALVFAISTIATYLVLCVTASAGLERLRLGRFERYGEVVSGGLIAFVGLAFWIWPMV